MHVLWGLKKQNTVFTIGKSIFDRSCCTDIGQLCLSYDGGGHANAGTCQIANENAERVREELIANITTDRSALVSSADQA
jgi:nanoRNase/pAp phosphatase (c-di-AMP/oligoRNAs hydrolase)